MVDIDEATGGRAVLPLLVEELGCQLGPGQVIVRLYEGGNPWRIYDGIEEVHAEPVDEAFGQFRCVHWNQRIKPATSESVRISQSRMDLVALLGLEAPAYANGPIA